jgi:DNA-binding IscR family transcriptional regulator
VTRQGSRGFALAVSPEKLTIAEIVEAITPNLYAISPEEQDRVVTVLEPLFERLDAQQRSLLSATLSDLKPD